MKRLFELVFQSVRAHGLWLWLAAYLLGIFIGATGRLGPGAGVWLLPIAVFLLAAAAVFRSPTLFAALLLCAAASLGVAREGTRLRDLERSRQLRPYLDRDRQRILFRLDDIPDRYPDYTVLWGTVEQIKVGEEWKPLRARTRIAVPESVPGVYRGDRVLAMASFREPREFVNPGGFDHVAFLRRRGILVTGFTASGRELALVQGKTPGFLARVDRVRYGFMQRLRGFPAPGSALMAALLLGDRQALGQDLQEVFQETGLAHLLAVSGLHLGLVAASFFFLAQAAVKRWPRLSLHFASARIAAVFAIPIVIAYALLTGMSVPTQRALVMVLTYLFAVALDREREVWGALGLAAAIVLLIWPEALFEASFQLSFSAVAGILYAGPRVLAAVEGYLTEEGRALARLEAALEPAAERLSWRVVRYFAGAAAITVLAQWAILPLQIKFFHTLNPLSPLYNLIAVPVCGLILLPGGLMVLALGLLLPWPAGWLMTALSILAGGLLKFLIFTSAHLPTLTLLPSFSGPGMAAWYLAGIFFLEGLVVFRTGVWSRQYFSAARYRALHLDSRPRTVPRFTRGQALFLLGPAALLFAFSVYDVFRSRDPFPEGSVVLAAIDVGQGQSLLVRTAAGRRLLVDGGGFYQGEFDVGKSVVAPCLLALGARRLDAVVLTHSHPDHFQGLVYVLKHFSVGEFWLPPDQNEPAAALTAIARARGIKVRRLTENSPAFAFHDAQVRPLGPPADPQLFASNLNNRSLVLRLESAGVSMLLTADIEAAPEARLLDRYGPAGAVFPNGLRARLLSVPHHGSRHSSSEEFIAAVAPAAALVSGAGVSSGLPAPETLARYAGRGIPIWGTDAGGLVALVAHGDSIGALRTGDLEP